MPRITKRAVDALQKGEKDAYLWDDELPGFGVKVTPTGRKVFLIQYRIGGAKGRTRRVTLGNLGPVTCDEARNRAKELLGMTKQGIDPAAERDKRNAASTLGEVIGRFLSEHVDGKTKPVTAKEYRRTLDLYVSANLRRRPLAEIIRADITKLHHDMKDTPSQANRLLAVLSKLFNWSEKQGLRPDGTNPCRHVERYAEGKRERFLSPQELVKLSTALTSDTRTYSVAAIRLLLFTGARLNEILSAKWDWVDFERGTIRLPDSKTGAKTLYLNAPALAVIEALPRVKGNPHLIVGDKKGAHLVNLQKAWRTIRQAAGIDDVRLHDLRHTFASFGVGGGMSLPMLGALLGHSQPQTTDRYSHLASDPMRAASDIIAGRIAAAMAQVDGPHGANVVPINKNKAG
jgi:integrase